MAAIAAQPAPAAVAPGPEGARLYRSLCAACHGPAGRGDGPLAASFPRTSIDLTKPRLFQVTERAPGVADGQGLARLIRGGAPGTSMAGHETLADREIAALAAEVLALRARAAERGTS